MIAEAVSAPTTSFSWLTFFTLALVLGLSVAIFAALVQRWTRARLWVDIATWARRHGFRAKLDLEEPPAPLKPALPEAALHLSAGVYNDEGGYFRLDSAETVDMAGSTATPQRWHVMVRKLQVEWPATALRPAGAESSFVDLYSLASFPLMGETHRFVIYGTDSAAARKLNASSIRSLVPPDVGLLLIGQSLLLDFSNRPFDPIAFDRLEALAASIASHLPG